MSDGAIFFSWIISGLLVSVINLVTFYEDEGNSTTPTGSLILIFIFCGLFFLLMGPLTFIQVLADGNHRIFWNVVMRKRLPYYALMLSPILALGLLWFM